VFSLTASVGASVVASVVASCFEDDNSVSLRVFQRKTRSSGLIIIGFLF